MKEIDRRQFLKLSATLLFGFVQSCRNGEQLVSEVGTPTLPPNTPIPETPTPFPPTPQPPTATIEVPTETPKRIDPRLRELAEQLRSNPTSTPELNPCTPIDYEVEKVLNEHEWELLHYMNNEREWEGLCMLQADPVLINIARIRSGQLIRSYSHNMPEGGQVFKLLQDFGYKYGFAGENIQRNEYPDPADTAHRSLMVSSSHKGNILSPNYDHVGVGWARYGKMNYFAQVFADKRT